MDKDLVKKFTQEDIFLLNTTILLMILFFFFLPFHLDTPL